MGTSNDFHPPLYYFVLKIWNYVVGDSVVSMRLLSALFTSSAVFFIYPLCKRVMSPVNAFVVLILYSFSPLNLYYSQEARMSAMNLFLNIGSVYFLTVLAVKNLTLKETFKDKTVYLYIIFTASALYTHYFSFFIVIAEVLYIIYLNRLNFSKYMSYLVSWLLIAVSYLLWISTFLEHMRKGQSWRMSQSLAQVLNEYVNYIKDMNFGLYYHYTDLTLIKYLTIFLSLVLILPFIGILLRKEKKSNDKTIVLVLLAAFVPLVLAGIISFRQKVEFYRYLSIIVPYILILLVYGLTKWNKKALVYPVIFCFGLINIFGISLHYKFDFKNDDYRELISRINTDFKAGDRIYVEPHYYSWIMDYYAKHPVDKKQENLKIPNPAYIRYGWNEILDSINTQKPERFWVVFDYSSVDTTKYKAYIRDLEDKFIKDFNMTYYLAPVKVELYRFQYK